MQIIYNKLRHKWEAGVIYNHSFVRVGLFKSKDLAKIACDLKLKELKNEARMYAWLYRPPLCL